MKRLYYVTKNLDDAEAISNEMHALGIDDHHFYVICRDDAGIKTHHLHGAKSLENTHILAAQKRANFFAALITVMLSTSIGLATALVMENTLVFVALCVAIFVSARVLTSLACASFDGYFRDVFDDHLDRGETVVIIDVARGQAKQVEKQLDKHPFASFIADSSNLASPIPG